MGSSNGLSKIFGSGSKLHFQTHLPERELMATDSRHLLVPIANEDDAEKTCGALESHLGENVERLTVVHVIEKAGGYIDKAPLEMREEQAERIFSFVESWFSTGPEIRRELRYGTDVVEVLLDAAEELDVDAIVFTPRPSSRLVRLLTGDSSYRLLTESEHPIFVFSRAERRE